MHHAEYEVKEYLPSDYISFIESLGEFYTETNIHLDIEFEPLDKIDQFNKDIEIEKYVKGFIGFACDGGGEIFAFNTQGKVYLLPLIGMSSNTAKEIAESWVVFKQQVLVNA
jgi:hypothetical protein